MADCCSHLFGSGTKEEGPKCLENHCLRCFPSVEMDEKANSKDPSGHSWPRSFGLSVPNKANSDFIFVGKDGSSQAMVSNVVITSRYEWWNFLFLNLFDQFHEVSNIYFLFVGFLQIWPAISTTQGVPDVYLPLSFILTVSGIRAAFDDYAKHKEDNARAAKPFLVFDPDHARENPGVTKNSQVQPPTGYYFKPSGDLNCGDIILINQNQTFPADILCLGSAHKKGHCFVETASLDGETNLKIKEAVATVHDELPIRRVKDEEKDEVKRQADIYAAVSEASIPLKHLKGRVYFGKPDKDLERLDGTLIVDKSFSKSGNGDDSTPLKGNNLLLRGTKLKNTPFIIGLVLYAGVDTKIRKNNEKPKGTVALKKSAIMSKVGTLLLYMLSLQLFLCLLSAVYSGTWQSDNQGAFYLDLSSNSAAEACLRFFTWFIILSQLVPISLVVTSEMIKYFQQLFMEMDVKMWDDKRGHLKVNYGQISEDLGQVEYVFSDKTGTLTQNKMEFRLAFIGSEAYGSAETDISKRVKAKQELAKTGAKPKKVKWTQTVKKFEEMKASLGEGIAFPEDEKKKMESLMWNDDTKQAKLVRNYLTHMAISNTITPVADGDQLVYNSSSPDELALCKYGAHMGFKFLSRSGAADSAVVTVEENRLGKKEKVQYRLQGVLGFDSVRKRVTVIYSDMGRTNVWIMCKGADSTVEPLISFSTDAKEAVKEKALLEDIRKKLLDASNYGLRTLMVTESKKPFAWWEERRAAFLQAKNLQPDEKTTKKQIKELRRAAYKKIELDAKMKLLGATAIEDQLQDLVPECIEDLLEGGVKVWMLTGDKRETAKNIAMACNLIEPDMIAIKPPDDKSKAGLREFQFDAAKALSENRLIEITGKWASIKDSKRDLTKLFKLIDQNGDGSIQKEELKMILEALQLPGDNIFGNLESKEITCEQFIKFIQSADINLAKAIETDIKAGLDRINSIADLDKYPVSMVVEGGGADSALGKISEGSGDKEKEGEETFYQTFMNYFKEEEVKVDRKDYENFLLKESFFELAKKCKSVVACRCTPMQKAWIVKEMKKRTGAVCLAIGDGGNDEPMIKEANVGVGIMGEEGSAAAQAADYAFGQFRFLHTLLFVHGAWSYERISIMVLYIFYKTAIAACTLFFFGFFSGFSGQQLFNPWIYTGYNAAFTALPIIIVGVLDQGLSAENLEDIPKAYRSIISRGQLFGTRIFFRWIMNAVVHTAIIFFTTFWCLDTTGITFSNGKVHGLWLTSVTIYTIIIFMVSFRLTFEMRSITWIHHFVFWGSLIVFVLVLIGLNVLPEFNPDLYFVAFAMWDNPQAWLTAILAGTLPLLLDLAIRGIKLELFPSYMDLLRERCRLRESYKASETFRFVPRQVRAQEKKHQEHIKAFKSKLNEASQRGGAPKKSSPHERVINTLLRWRDLTGAILDATEDAADMLNIDQGKGEGKVH